MRQRRIDRGALTLASAEVKFQIDTETHDPLDIGQQLNLQKVLIHIKEFRIEVNYSFIGRNVSDPGGKSND